MIIIFGSFMNSVTISIHKMLTLTLARKGLIVVVVVMSVCGSLVKTTICGVNRCAKNTQSECDGYDCKCKRNYSFRKTFKQGAHSVQKCFRECSSDNDCPAHSTCFEFIDSDGYDSYGCDCQQGYVWHKHYDVCIGECSSNNNCPAHSTCIWFTYSQGHDRYGCDCQQGYVWHKHYDICIGECYGDNDCPAHSTCIWFIYSQGYDRYGCDCQQGYVLSKHNDICIDINECKDGNVCQDLSNTFCNNTKGSYICDCLPGYNSSARNRSCGDINECETMSEVCGNHSECVNVPGNYTCHCRNGYELNLDGNSTCILAQLGSRTFEQSSSRSLVGLYIGLPIAVVVSLVVGITVILIRRKRFSQKSRDDQAENSEETIANNVNVISEDSKHDSALSIKMADMKPVSLGITRAIKPHCNLNQRKSAISVDYSNHKIPENKKNTEPKGNLLNDETGSPTSVTSIDGQIPECDTYNVLDVCNLKTNPVDKNVLYKDTQNTYNALYDVNPTSMNLTQDKIGDGFEAKCTQREEISQESNSNTSPYDLPKTLKEDQEQGIHKDSETEVIYENKHNSSDYYNLTGLCDTNVSSTD